MVRIDEYRKELRKLVQDEDIINQIITLNTKYPVKIICPYRNRPDCPIRISAIVEEVIHNVMPKVHPS